MAFVHDKALLVVIKEHLICYFKPCFDVGFKECKQVEEYRTCDEKH